MKVTIDDLRDIWVERIGEIFELEVNEEEKEFIYNILLDSARLWKGGRSRVTEWEYS